MPSRQKFNSSLTRICVLHTVLFVLVVGVICAANLKLFPPPLDQKTPVFWMTVGLAGLVGALLYFARKCYVYQINDKYDRISEGTSDEQVIGARIGGYYLYLITRPLAGIAVGPIAAMIVMGGISTIGRHTSVTGPQSVSDVGIYIILLAAFVGGYTSSDLFDGLANFGKSVLRPRASD